MKSLNPFKSEKNLIRFEFIAGIIFAIGATMAGSAYYQKVTDGMSIQNFVQSHSMFCVEQKIACE